MNSKSKSGDKIYTSTIGISKWYCPLQTLDLSNNKGFGYNLSVNSNFISSVIRNGVFENCNIGISSTYSAD
jgi:hypothetical protein